MPLNDCWLFQSSCCLAFSLLTIWTTIRRTAAEVEATARVRLQFIFEKQAEDASLPFNSCSVNAITALIGNGTLAAMEIKFIITIASN